MMSPARAREAAGVPECWHGDDNVERSVDRLMSHEPADVARMFSLTELGEMNGQVAELVERLVVRPVREIADRGGKRWRASIMIDACESLGGQGEVLAPWVGVIELLHVGSLIIDDIQDGSSMRRGGRCCHEIYGVPAAINAGTCAYFFLDRLVEDLPIPLQQKTRLYRIFFEAMRAAHAGQALDLHGLLPLAEQAVRRRDIRSLTRAVETTHIHKTGIPVALCSLIGAVTAGASEDQIRAMADYGVAVGLAFQIGDDILNLTGFASGLKQLGEDIATGKVTYPIALALGALSESDGQELVGRLRECSPHPDNIERALSLIHSVSACERARTSAQHELASTWARLERHLAGGPARERLRAWGIRFLDRHD
jgi:geranylgeranyl pyrophosphate synthase